MEGVRGEKQITQYTFQRGSTKMHAKNNNDMQEINKLEMHGPVEEA